MCVEMWLRNLLSLLLGKLNLYQYYTADASIPPPSMMMMI